MDLIVAGYVEIKSPWHRRLVVNNVVRRRSGDSAAPQHGGLEVRVTASVLDQVIAAHEALLAQRALEALLPRVGAGVAGELVGASELLLAVGPGARERPLTCNREEEHVHL